MTTATFRFCEELNDFLAPARRGRDRELLNRRTNSHGCYVHTLRSGSQLREVFDRLDLARSARPFTRCLACNALLHPVDEESIEAQLPPRVRECFQRFAACDGCGRVFWEGSHWRRMRELVDSLCQPVGG